MERTASAGKELVLLLMMLCCLAGIAAVDFTLNDKASNQTWNLTNNGSLYDPGINSYNLSATGQFLNATTRVNITAATWTARFRYLGGFSNFPPIIMSQLNGNEVVMRIWNNGQISCAYGNGSTALEGRAGISLANQTWYTIACRVNASGTLDNYINNVKSTVGTFTPPQINITRLEIGYDRTSGRYYNGSLSDIRIYSSALTTSQLQGLYLNQSVACASAISLYPFTNVSTDVCNNFCTYQGSGSWNAGGADACANTAATNILRNNMTVQYNGTFSLTGNISNFTIFDARNGATVTVSGGGVLG